jgi:hypothetical protein
MKTQKECYEALLRGEKLVQEHRYPLYLNQKGKLVFTNEQGNEQGYSESFVCPDKYEIYTEPKKRVRYAPALYASGLSGRHMVGRDLFASEQIAKDAYGIVFIRWLIDTPYAVEVEE